MKPMHTMAGMTHKPAQAETRWPERIMTGNAAIVGLVALYSALHEEWAWAAGTAALAVIFAVVARHFALDRRWRQHLRRESQEH